MPGRKEGRRRRRRNQKVLTVAHPCSRQPARAVLGPHSNEVVLRMWSGKLRFFI